MDYVYTDNYQRSTFGETGDQGLTGLEGVSTYPSSRQLVWKLEYDRFPHFKAVFLNRGLGGSRGAF